MPEGARGGTPLAPGDDGIGGARARTIGRGAPPVTRRPLAAALAAAFALPGAGAAAAWTVDAERSTFAVLVHRAGFASRFAHDHLVVARSPACALDFDPGAPAAARLACRQAVLALDVDPPAERARLAPRLAALGALAGALPAIPEEDRRDIRAAMLDAKQLFAERFPEIRGELVALAPDGGGTESTWSARLRVELRGETVETTAPLRWRLAGGELTAELLAELAFTEFRIEPYSALLGAVRNADRFHLYVEIVARPAGGETSGGAALTDAP
jgi:hypothetical protein